MPSWLVVDDVYIVGIFDVCHGRKRRVRLRCGGCEYCQQDLLVLPSLTCLKLDDNSPRSFGDSVSGWWLLVNRWNPFSNARNIPAITEIQSRLA